MFPGSDMCQLNTRRTSDENSLNRSKMNSDIEVAIMSLSTKKIQRLDGSTA
jgi:hypothetical protein